LIRILLAIVFISSTLLDAEELRVLLKKNVEGVVFYSSVPLNFSDKNGKIIITKKENKVKLFVKENLIVLEGFGALSSPVSVKSLFLIYLDGKPYRGYFNVYLINSELFVVNVVDLEEYLYGVVPNEIPVSWSDEVIKAQSVVARTFALSRKSNLSDSFYDLDDSTFSQVYGGYSKENERINSLVDRTKGEILYYAGEPALAYYHSTCGGKTESSENIWGKDIPYLKTVQCNWCKNSPYFEWQLEISSQRLVEILKKIGKNFDSRNISVKIIDKNSSGRVANLEFFDNSQSIVMKANNFRNLVGTSELKSLNFIVTKRNNLFLFKGYGWGHGVGMCQWGAKNMSDQGIDYRRILQYYFRGVKLVKKGKNY